MVSVLKRFLEPLEHCMQIYQLGRHTEGGREENINITQGETRLEMSGPRFSGSCC